MRLGKRERAAKRERLALAQERLMRVMAEVPQVWGGFGSPKPLMANGNGPAYRWPIVGKCRLNPQRRSLVTRKPGLLDSLANIAKHGVRLKFELGRNTYPKELEAANILLGD